MKETQHRQVAAELFDLVRQMEQILKDYCRLLAAHDDGHCLEPSDTNEQL